jgi:hypothetical protein
MEDFEKILNEMSKPEIKNLKHQDLLAKNILSAKRKTALSWWWVCIPLYVLGAFIMKGFYRHSSSLSQNLSELTIKNKYMVYLFFIGLPFVAIIINAATIFKLSSISKGSMLKNIIPNILIIILAVIVFVIYLIN